MTQEELDLLHGHLNGTLDEEDFARLQLLLREDADARRTLRTLSTVEVKLQQLGSANPATLRLLAEPAMTPAPFTRSRAWYGRVSWRPLAAAAAGLVVGMLCTSVVFAYAMPKSPAVLAKLLPLADSSFESGTPVPALGIPARAGVWSGDFSRVVTAENGITSNKGQRMLRILRADNERSQGTGRSYVGEVAQVIDLRQLRAELSGAESLVEVSAQFNSIPATGGAKYEFNVKAAAFRGSIADAPQLWEDHEASVSRADRTIAADSDMGTWQRVAVPLVVPPDADFLVIEGTVVFKGVQAQGATEFPGHYVDAVELRLGSSSTAWAATQNTK